jgi:hypothetical protein
MIKILLPSISWVTMKLNALVESITFGGILEGLAHIGEFLTGAAAILAFYYARKALQEYWVKKQSEAAILALSRLRACIDEILDISNRRHGYQYPSFLQEIASQKEEQHHPERPPRLISSKMVQLKKDLQHPIAQISGEPAVKLLNLISDLQQYCVSLGSAIYADLGGNTKEIRQSAHIQNTLQNYSSKLQSVLEQAEKILIPIIESPKDHKSLK